MTEESLPLDGVHEDDRVNVGNVITVIKALRKCVSWAVTPSGGAYEVMAMLDSKREAELAVTLQDMELIQQVDPLRVTHVGVQVSSRLDFSHADRAGEQSSRLDFSHADSRAFARYTRLY